MKMAESVTFAERFNGISGSAIRDIFKLIAQPNMISFAGGNPSSRALEEDVISEFAREVLAKDGKAILQYGATEGYAPLRESIADFCKSILGFSCQESEILPISGSTQAMDLLCKTLINPGDTILAENPTFLGNMQCMRLYQANIVPVSTDNGGVILEDLEEKIKKHHPKMLYIIPTFQNPTGITLAADRREKIAELAEKYGVIIAEDDPYRDLRYRGTALPTIKSYDKAGWVIYLGSFSKLISPGMRVGFLVSGQPLLRKLTVGKQSADVHTSNLTEAIIDAYLRSGKLPAHIKDICSFYGEQMNAMLSELSKFPAGTTHTQPDGGLFIWAALPNGINALDMLKKCIEHHVAYVPGTHFFVDGGHLNTLRLNFSMSPVDKIHEGMTALREVLENEIGG
ncbi:MAG: PLP-dependent aminotransferase family protein [Eubacteriales bacterium]|nr:PLP-dependent aminotransferase family protein [Eubacteriales bacterium]MDD3882749.1 PLP-dependent aminotransferase family protein [Eubacteriales bacterium]MDD4512630.1 PLP-dependent aminotransferase family protein [Eubacteriales bacterium]